MVASVVVAGVSDEELAEAAAAGDEEAFDNLRQRYAGPIYDLLARMAHSREEATALARVTFDEVRKTLGGRRFDRGVRPWLYALARQVAVDASRRRQVALMEDEAAMSEAEGDLDEALAADAWRAAAALAPEEYAVLHYQLRAGLKAREIAEAMSLRPEMVYTVLSRAHEALSDAFALLQFARRGKRDCAGLELLLGLRPPVPLDRATRQAFRRHLEGCAKCRMRRARFAAPAEVLSALTPVFPLEELRLVPSRPEPAPVALPALRALPPRRRVNHWAVPAAALGGATLAILFFVSRGPLPDRTPPAAPQVMSTTHVPWVASAQRSVEVQWSGAADRPGQRERDSGVAGYSVSWSSQPGDVPAARAQTSAERLASPELADGVWWFHLRTVDRAGNATEPVHIGPFVISEPPPASSEPRPKPPRTPSSSEPRPKAPRAL
jgi:DNA-directed RNA polymerase specialized sigma24 family protein